MYGADLSSLLVGWLIGAIVVGFLATTRGHGFLGYFLISALLSPLIGLIILLVSQPGNRGPCWQCKELVVRGASKCPHCGAELTWPGASPS